MINEERYVLAELKRWLVNQKEYMSAREVICQIAKIEAGMVLGEDFETEPEPAYENDEEGES